MTVTDSSDWKSSNTGIATVNGGLVTAIAEGSAAISAEYRYQGKNFSYHVIVTVIPGCNILPVFPSPPEISANPDVVAIQAFNRVLIDPEATDDQVLPFVSRDYNYAGEDFDTFVANNLPMLGRARRPAAPLQEGFFLCSIGLIKEEITISGDTATNVITYGRSGTRETDFSGGASPLSEEVDHHVEQYDFVKGTDGQWRFVALRTLSGGFTQIRGGTPPLSIVADITPIEAISPGEELRISGQIPGVKQTHVGLRWGTTGFDEQKYPPPQGDSFDVTLQFGEPSTRLPIGTDYVSLLINSDIVVETHQSIMKTFRIPAPSAIGEPPSPPPSPPPPPLPSGTTNLARGLGTTTRVSSSSFGYAPERAIDGNLSTSWFTARGDAANLGTAPFYEAILPTDAVVSRIKMFGNRQFARGYDFFAGRFELFDRNDALLFDSGIVDLPAPDRDISLLIPDIMGVRKVRFTATADESDEPGFAELEVIGTFQ